MLSTAEFWMVVAFVLFLTVLLYSLGGRWRSWGSFAVVVLAGGLSITWALLGYLSASEALPIAAQGRDPVPIIAHTQDLVALFGVIIAIGAVGITMFGFWLTARLERLSELDKRMDEVSKLAVVAVESALMSLPPQSQSQQIPERVMRTLSVMNRLIFEDPDRTLLNYLDKIQNGARIHLAKAIFEYGRAQFDLAEKELDKTLEHATDAEIREDALWFKAITLRQRHAFKESRKTLEELGENVALQAQVLVGHALNCLASQGKG